MYKYVISFLTLSVVIFALYSCNNVKEYHKERIICGIKVEDCHYDVGTAHVPNDSIHQFCYIFQNTTNQDIEIDSTEVSCDCLYIDYSPVRIKANSNDSLTGHIDITKLKGDFSRSIYVNFNSGDIMLLRVIGRVD